MAVVVLCPTEAFSLTHHGEAVQLDRIASAIP